MVELLANFEVRMRLLLGGLEVFCDLVEGA